MSKKHKKDGTSPTRVGASSPPNDWPETEAHIEELLRGQHSKAAVEAAKELHKRRPTPQSESLLVEAYQARIRDLLKLGMAVEARSLHDLVVHRFPSARGAMEEALFELRLQEGNLDALLAPLEDPGLAPAARERLETVIRQRVYDLRPLSRTSSLSPDSSLRQAAGALLSVLEKVTSGPAEDADLLLPEVSRRSPLAPWKALANAIAHFYRREDTVCRRWLETIPADSVPARLVPAIHSMLGSAATPSLNSAAQKLVAATGGGAPTLRNALVSLESVFAARKRQQISKNVAAAVSACRQLRPDLCERLCEMISVRAMMLNMPPHQVQPAAGRRPRDSARWYRLMARALESTKVCESMCHALIVWYEFRESALRENWFAAGTPEEGLIWLHMAELAARIPPDVIEDYLEPNAGQAGSLKIGPFRLPELFSPDWLYEKACAADPHPEGFESWLSWAKKQPDRRKADRAAEAWHAARPQDVGALLWLMDASERRSAYQKSLNYLEQAEQLDRLNPAVQRAKLRLLVASALRHFRQRKPHLAGREIERIEQLPEPDGSLTLLASALRSVSRALDTDSEATAKKGADAETSGRDPVSAYVLERAIAERALDGEKTFSPPADVNSEDTTTLVRGLAKACALGDRAGIPLAIPREWQDRLMAAFMSPAFAHDTAEMLVVGQAAIRSQAFELAFAVSVAGMARGGADARFLYLRARALPPWAAERRYGCLSAALELARRERDTDLSARVLDALHEQMMERFEPDEFFDEMGPGGYAIGAVRLSRLLEEERAATRFPRPPRRTPVERAPVQRAPKANLDDGFPDFDDIIGNMPPEVLHELTKAIALGANPLEILKYASAMKSWDGKPDEAFDFLPPVGSPELKVQKKVKPTTADPNQQNLF
jgi:hypothetical protein